ncbi:MAG: hypothetical protein P8P26_00690 [Porticoccaceae bacterium]|nr:hypothetical protein [Porticoccaceae bacterium]
MKKYIFITVLSFLTLFLNLDSLADEPIKALENQRANRILFVGNSYLYYNDSLHNHVRRMAAERFPENAKLSVYKSATIGGSKLSHHNLHYLMGTENIGVKRNFELVILQGGSSEPLSEDSRQAFYHQVEEKAGIIRAKGSEIALYMTHAYVEPHKASDSNMINLIKRTYLKAGDDNNILVIPVGLAFARAYERYPDLRLHKVFDGSHPSLLGTYLAACVVFASIFNSSSVGLTYDYFDTISDDNKIVLQDIADKTVADFYSRQD